MIVPAVHGEHDQLRPKFSDRTGDGLKHRPHGVRFCFGPGVIRPDQQVQEVDRKNFDAASRSISRNQSARNAASRSCCWLVISLTNVAEWLGTST